jgi:hypothetical protein
MLKMLGTVWGEAVRALSASDFAGLDPPIFDQPGDRRVESAWPKLDVCECADIYHDPVTVFGPFRQTREDKQLWVG